MLDLHRLTLLRELSDRGTLAAVATALSYSPSAISQQLSQLEAETGVVLTERVGRRLVLTAQAEILVGHTEALLERIELAERDLAASLTEIAGTVRLAAFQSAAHAYVPDTVAWLTEQYPALRLEVSERDPEDALPALLSRDFDLVLGEEYPGHPLPPLPGVESEDLAQDVLSVARPIGAAPARLRTLGQLAGRPWVLEPAGSIPRLWAMTACRAAGFEPDVRYVSSDLLLHLRLVETGHAVAFVPDLVRRDGFAVHVQPLPGRPARRIFTAARRGAAGHPAIMALRASLRRAVQRSRRR